MCKIIMVAVRCLNMLCNDTGALNDPRYSWLVEEIGDLNQSDGSIQRFNNPNPQTTGCGVSGRRTVVFFSVVLFMEIINMARRRSDGDWEPPLGPYLGNLTDEVGLGSFISEYASGGPKTYGYRTNTNKICMKAKGITLNAVNSEAIRLDTLIGLVNHYVGGDGTSRHILARMDGIVRDKKRFTLHNKSVDKCFRVNYNKRVLLDDYTTLPYGY
ncbi:uncharacterized protein LOC130549912 [Triplophysa rosa]|uniref:uncharacterized protein LOC130549912 n=1 Tax=Triplophysa rosa TaxID=992332 RepID=UPI002545F449|nr:uncharacterized protein LOC130549912 [Triplophysa rosa]